jgi:hypothetical protein
MHGKTHLPEVKEVLAVHEASIIRKINENLGVDIRGDTTVYQKPYPSRFDWAPSPANFQLPDFIKFSGEDNRSTREHVSQYLAQLGEASSSAALTVRMFSLSLTGIAFSWFASLAPGLINSWLNLEKKFHEHFFSGSNELKCNNSGVCLASVHHMRMCTIISCALFLKLDLATIATSMIECMC